MGAFLYILHCADGSYYVGTTRLGDVEVRVGEHNAGIRDGYTFSRRPVMLAFSEEFQHITDAIAAERQVKGWTRAKKAALIRREFELLPMLAKRPSARVKAGRSDAARKSKAGDVLGRSAGTPPVQATLPPHGEVLGRRPSLEPRNAPMQRGTGAVRGSRAASRPPHHEESGGRHAGFDRSDAPRRTPSTNAIKSAGALLTASAVRKRANILHAAAEAGRLFHFVMHPGRLPAVADYVVETIRANYPSLAIPFHARWRHFVVDGADRWAALAARARFADPAARARAEFDLAIVSVLLDAGAGAAWAYPDAVTGRRIGRSEGLAIASLDMFAAGAFSAEPRDPLRADAARLAAITAADIGRGFSVSDDNPLEGLEGRAALLGALGRAVDTKPEVFARKDTSRPGGLFDLLAGEAKGGKLPAPKILDALLAHLGPIWPSRLTLGGVALGDTWRHPMIETGDATAGLVPFHKLSQWLAYSLIEPLQRAGIDVTDIDGLTGLPEYRNGGLFLDLGAITLKDPADAARPHEPGSTLVVEWRALTVALLDRLAPLVRERLGLSAEEFPLAKLLEGGTWAAGRRIAREKRNDGGPPLSIRSDGTVF